MKLKEIILSLIALSIIPAQSMAVLNNRQEYPSIPLNTKQATGLLNGAPVQFDYGSRVFSLRDPACIRKQLNDKHIRKEYYSTVSIAFKAKLLSETNGSISQYVEVLNQLPNSKQVSWASLGYRTIIIFNVELKQKNGDRFSADGLACLVDEAIQE